MSAGRYRINGCLLLGFFATATSVVVAEDTESPRPNIVVILADDLGTGDLGSYNPYGQAHTPALDQLAKEGVRFTDAHSPSSVCTPTRYGLLTGRYAWRTRMKSGVLNGYSKLLIDPARATIASVLRSSGYRTGCYGKWHLGLGTDKNADYAKPLLPGPLELGFDRFFGIPASLDMAPYVFVDGHHPEEAPSDTVEGSGMARSGGGGFWRAGPISPSFRHKDVLPRVVDEAIAFLASSSVAARANGEARQPFFLYLALPAPHTPWLPSQEFQGTSGAGVYGDFVGMVDDQVGRVLSALSDQGLAEDTLVVFTSDNGAHWTPTDIKTFPHRANQIGDQPLRGQKADVFEGGHRVPFLVRWPGRVAGGGVSPALTGLTDIMATVVEAAGESLPDQAGPDSVSMIAALLDPNNAAPRSSIVHHAFDGMFSFRRGSWKLIDGLGSGGFTSPKRTKPVEGGPVGQLYHLGDDPAESVNRYAEEPEVVRELMEELARIKGTDEA